MKKQHNIAAVGFAILFAFAPAVVRAQEEAKGLTLARALEIALEKSPLLQAAQHRVEAASAGVEQARAGFFPTLNFHESFTRADNPAFVFSSKLNQGRFTTADFETHRLNHPSAMSNFRTNLSFAQPIYTGGKTSLGLQQATLHKEATVLSADRRQQEVLFQVVRAYYGLLLAQADLEVVRSAMRTAEANRDVTQARFETGLVVESDVLAADVRVSRLKEQEIIAENQTILARATLNDVIGLPLDQSFEVVDRLTQRPARFERPAELEALALVRRPDYLKMGVEEKVLGRGIALAQTEFHPTLSATANYELNHLDVATNGRDSWFVGVVFQWNLFNGLHDRAKVAEAKARLEEIRALRTRMVSGMKLEVKDAYLKLRAAEERIGVARKAAAQAEESLRIVKDRYEAGLTTVVDLLTSEAVLTQAKGNLAQALYDYNVGLASLELALGTMSKDSFS